MLVNVIRYVQICKSFRDWEFCEIFFRYCGHYKVLRFCVFPSHCNTLIL